MSFTTGYDFTAAELATLAWAARSAYSGAPILPGWTVVTPAELGLAATYQDGLYYDGNILWSAAAAIVLRSGNDFIVSFRGTDGVADYLNYPDLLAANNYVHAFRPLLDALRAYAPTGATFDFTGHSLGGGAANQLAAVATTDFGGYFADARFATFAAPVLNGSLGILNVGFENDVIFEVVGTSSSATDHLFNYNDGFDDLLPFPPWYAHDITQYVGAMERLAESTFTSLMSSDSWIVFDFTSAAVELSRIDTGGAALFALGSATADEIIGASEISYIEGFGGNDNLTGGAGNDVLDGGAGIDRAVFTDVVANYTITHNTDDSYTIRCISGASGDGTDTLWNIESARFADQVVTLDPLAGPFDIVFLQDLTGSFSDDLPIMKGVIGNIATSLLDDYAGSRIAVTSFLDRGDAYIDRVETDFTTSSGAIVTTYEGFTADFGGDTPEAQLTALMDAATNTGLSYISGHARIFVLVSDAPYHPYVDIPALKAAFADNSIIPIFAVTSDVAATYDDLVAQLGVGTTVTISSNSSDIADSVRYALASLNSEITGFGDSGDNTLIGSDSFFDHMFGLGGADLISGLGGRDLLDGGAGDDRLDGGAGDDHVIGGTGHDKVLGGAGADIVDGNEGDDILVGDAMPLYVGSGVVDDSAAGNYSGATARSLDGSFNLALDANIANSEGIPHVSVSGIGNGNVRYYSFTALADGSRVSLDVDGASFDTFLAVYDAAGTRILINDDSSLIDSGSTSTRDSFVQFAVPAAGTYYAAVGAYPGLSIVPVGGAYMLHVSVDGPVIAPSTDVPGGGDDDLDGGAGADVMMGGDGNDEYYVDSVGDQVFEAVGAGFDIVYSTLTHQLATNVEAVYLTGAAASNATGTAAANWIYGNAAVNTLRGGGGGDLLDGGGGNDVLYGDAGSDLMRGGTGDDTYHLDNVGDQVTESVEAGFDIVYSTATHTLGANVEAVYLTGAAATNATGTAAANWIYGNAAVNTLRGGGGGDLLDGGGGNDFLYGDAGNDLMRGGAGDDTYHVETAGDQVSEAFGAGFDIVYSTATHQLGANVEAVYLTGAAATNATGTAAANWIYGNAAVNTLRGGGGGDLLDGGSGNDFLYGDAGNDVLRGGAGDDTFYVDNVGDQVTESVGAGFDIVYSTATHTLGANVEAVYLTGAAATNATGTAAANWIYGNAAVNTLRGGGGGDLLDGGGGHDFLYGDAGNDLMRGGAGDDTYYVDSSGDMITELAGAGLDIVYSSATHTLGSNVEAVYLTGGAAANASGTDAANWLYGNTAVNTLRGGGGNDLLDGGGGGDFIHGDAGNDVLRGGAGNDMFVFSGTFGQDSIMDFQSGDVVRLSASQFANFAAVTAVWSDVGGNTEITQGINKITIFGLTTSQLDVGDFGFI